METKRLREMDDVERVRAEIKHRKRIGATDNLTVQCRDYADADALALKLTDDERNQIHLTWLVK